MPLPPGTRLGAYEIVALLGAGGMGEVHRAHDTRLGRDVAIKVLPPEVTSTPERRARFESEARIVARLNHPNIVTLHSIEESDGTRFLTMEMVDGRTLGELIRSGGLPLAQVLDLAIPLTDALVAAHEKGVVHRDLKPANVMVTPAGRVKVLDFGLAKILRDESDPAPSRTVTMTSPISMAGEVLGTAPYMAPEQISGDAVDPRTDLFALGIILFELVTGQRPFAGRTFWEVTAAIMRDSPPMLRSLRLDAPVDLERLVRRCLEKRPSDRFQTAQEVADELRALKRGTMPAATTPPKGTATIAVLPFVNRSASADDEYFSDGLADELLSLLAKIKGLRVSARASSFQFKGRNIALDEVGKALNVETVLDGSVRRSGDRVRIAVQLVKVSDGYHLWSETYDRTLDDIFAVQDDIARSVVKELRTTLLGEAADSEASGRAKEEVDRAARGRSTDPEAHRLYLLARHNMDQLNRDSTTRAVAHLNQALEREPGFPLAWAELSRAYVRQADWGMMPLAEGRERAREAVEHALALEPDLSDGHLQVAWLRMFHDWDWKGAEASLARALELAPGSASVIRLSGILASFQGRLDEAMLLIRQALEQDPLSAATYHSLGFALHVTGDLAGAEESFRKALELSPQRMGTRAHLAMTLLAQGRHQDALTEATGESEDGYRQWALAIVHHALSNETDSESALDRLIRQHSASWSVQVAEVMAARGDVSAAFDWLDRAYNNRDLGLARLKLSPALRSLHGDPRWGAFLGKMRLE